MARLNPLYNKYSLATSIGWGVLISASWGKTWHRPSLYLEGIEVRQLRRASR
jgi:hypothetical protein